MAENVLIYVFCICISVVLLLGNLLRKKENTHSMHRFSIVVTVFIIYMTMSALSELMEGKPNLWVLSFILNLLSFFAIDALVISFSGYMFALMEETGRPKENPINPITVSCFLRAAVVLILAVTDNLFAIENGFYVERSLSIIPYLISAAIMVEFLVYVFYYKALFTRQQKVVIILYLVLPVVPIVLETVTNLYTLTAVSMTLSILLVYNFIQVSLMDKGKQRETVLVEISATDPMTKLSNRRAFTDAVAALEPSRTVGVLFCDINGLKYANDHYGHAMGDKLICRFSDLLRSCFDETSVFRISGDEFVVLLPDVTEHSLVKSANKLRALIAENDSIAAVGYSFGFVEDFEHLFSMAEDFMYVDKGSRSRDSAVSAEAEK